MSYLDLNGLIVVRDWIKKTFADKQLAEAQFMSDGVGLWGIVPVRRYVIDTVVVETQSIAATINDIACIDNYTVRGSSVVQHCAICAVVNNKYYLNWVDKSGTFNKDKYINPITNKPYYCKVYALYNDMASVGQPPEGVILFRNDGEDSFQLVPPPEVAVQHYTASDGIGEELKQTLSSTGFFRAVEYHNETINTTDDAGIAYTIAQKPRENGILVVASKKLSQFGIVNQVSTSGSGNSIVSLSHPTGSRTITATLGWRQPFITKKYLKQTSNTQRLYATEDSFCVLDFTFGSGVYLGFTPLTSTAHSNHWSGVILKKAGQPINITKPTNSSTQTIICNVNRQTIVNGTALKYDARIVNDGESDILLLEILPVGETITFN